MLKFSSVSVLACFLVYKYADTAVLEMNKSAGYEIEDREILGSFGLGFLSDGLPR